MLERLQISNMNLKASIEFLQLELIKKFNQQKNNQETFNTTKFVIKCKYCVKDHERRKTKYLSLGKIYSNCKKKYHFQVICNYKRRTERQRLSYRKYRNISKKYTDQDQKKHKVELYIFSYASVHGKWCHFNAEELLGENGLIETEKEQSPVEAIRRNCN